jgi:hypothetical protein
MIVEEKGEEYLAEFLDVRYVKRDKQRIGHTQTTVHTGDHLISELDQRSALSSYTVLTLS